MALMKAGRPACLSLVRTLLKLIHWEYMHCYNKPFSCKTALFFPVALSHQHLMELQEDRENKWRVTAYSGAKNDAAVK